MAVHVRFDSYYITIPSSSKQQEMTKFYVFLRTRTVMANFWHLLLELNAVGAYLASANCYLQEPRDIKITQCKRKVSHLIQITFYIYSKLGQEAEGK